MLETTVVNPLREGLRLQRTPEPCVMVIFGASGDLTRRKLVPALYNLTRERLLPGGFTVVGV
ncbi:MAG: glucose-6-phosphate dehydrogenase, partial [Chloroflexota bacterium]|nr:glucose-6-phosphate dehydrogenase [Chloroflexota bacterium]